MHKQGFIGERHALVTHHLNYEFDFSNKKISGMASAIVLSNVSWFKEKITRYNYK